MFDLNTNLNKVCKDAFNVPHIIIHTPCHVDLSKFVMNKVTKILLYGYPSVVFGSLPKLISWSSQPLLIDLPECQRLLYINIEDRNLTEEEMMELILSDAKLYAGGIARDHLCFKIRCHKAVTKKIDHKLIIDAIQQVPTKSARKV
jgi:hypothetical protein